LAFDFDIVACLLGRTGLCRKRLTAERKRRGRDEEFTPPHDGSCSNGETALTS
jgi:hypothetical protein